MRNGSPHTWQPQHRPLSPRPGRATQSRIFTEARLLNESSTQQRRMEGTEHRTTLVNHSTVLMQQRGSNILTDPVWSERASPLTWIGPRRRRKPGISWDDLPAIDTVFFF